MPDLFSSLTPDRIEHNGVEYIRADLIEKKADDSGFDKFWANVPTGFKIGREEARKAFSNLKADDKHTAVNSVGPFYAHWTKAHPEASKLHPCRFLKNKRWTDEGWEAKAAPTAIDKQQATIDNIKSGQRWRCTNITATQARDLIDKGLVTETECKKAGVL